MKAKPASESSWFIVSLKILDNRHCPEMGHCDSELYSIVKALQFYLFFFCWKYSLGWRTIHPCGTPPWEWKPFPFSCGDAWINYCRLDSVHDTCANVVNVSPDTHLCEKQTFCVQQDLFLLASGSAVSHDGVLKLQSVNSYSSICTRCFHIANALGPGYTRD
jgi:hypothetical protein